MPLPRLAVVPAPDDAPAPVDTDPPSPAVVEGPGAYEVAVADRCRSLGLYSLAQAYEMYARDARGSVEERAFKKVNGFDRKERK